MAAAFGFVQGSYVVADARQVRLCTGPSLGDLEMYERTRDSPGPAMGGITLFVCGQGVGGGAQASAWAKLLRVCRYFGQPYGSLGERGIKGHNPSRSSSMDRRVLTTIEVRDTP